MEIGNDIGEPIAVLCHTSSKTSSGMVKLHLKNPEIDALTLLHGTRPFVLELDGNKPLLAKVAKGYDIIAKALLYLEGLIIITSRQVNHTTCSRR